MRSTLIFLLLLLPAALPAQSFDDAAARSRAHAFVARVEDTAAHPLWHYTFRRTSKTPAPRVTTYHYWTDKMGRIQKMAVSPPCIGCTEEIVFYLRYGALIYAAEEVQPTDPGAPRWSAEYVFEGGKLKYLSSNGHGKSETDDWEPEKEVPAAYRQALARVEAHRKRRR